MPVLLKRKIVEMQLETGEISEASVPDKNGSPMKVSVIINYQVIDPVASEYNIDQEGGYVTGNSIG